jgi:hypothetical protein
LAWKLIAKQKGSYYTSGTAAPNFREGVTIVNIFVDLPIIMEHFGSKTMCILENNRSDKAARIERVDRWIVRVNGFGTRSREAAKKREAGSGRRKTLCFALSSCLLRALRDKTAPADRPRAG